MALTTELVLAAGGGFETVTQTIGANSGSVWLPAGVWLCTLTGTVRITSTQSTGSWISLAGTRATCDKVGNSTTNNRAMLGVVLPSVTGGTTLDVNSSLRSGDLTFWAARIG